MKSPGLLIFMSACFIIFAGNLYTQVQSFIASQTLTSTESSSGLSNPEWEGGRTELEFADINADGLLDIITIGDHGSPFINTEEHGIMVYFGDGAGNWSVQMTGDFGYGGIAAGDVNNDGFMDFVAGYEYGTVYFGDGTGDFILKDLNLPPGGLVGRLGPSLGDGNGTWTPDATFTTGDPGYSQAFLAGGDVDHNGRPDIVLLEEEELSWFTYQNYLRCYRESSVPVLLAIKPVFPCGHELLWQNSVRFIDWISTVPGNEAAEIKLEYSTIGPDGPWTLIAAELPNSGRHQWLVPQENSADCYIRQTVITEVNSHSSITPAAFTITDGTIGVDEMKPEGMGISVYPNPAGRQLTVDSQQSAVKMVITDLFGRGIKECANISSFPFLLDISDLQPGMYILRAINKDGESGSAKFLKISE